MSVFKNRFVRAVGALGLVGMVAACNGTIKNDSYVDPSVAPTAPERPVRDAVNEAFGCDENPERCRKAAGLVGWAGLGGAVVKGGLTTGLESYVSPP